MNVDRADGVRVAVLSAVVLVSVCAAAAMGEHRVALLIGNSDYGKHKLATPGADVEAVAGALERIGFQTRVERDLDTEALRRVMDRFVQGVPTRGTALVYFAGYALGGQDDGRRDDFLLPVGEEYHNSRDVGNRGVGTRELLRRLHEQSGSAANIVVVDGCYAYPEELQGVPTGLTAHGEIAPNSVVLYAAAPGEVAAPSDEGRSRLAEALCDMLRAGQGGTREAFEEVAARVRQRSGGEQSPWLGTTLGGEHNLLAAAAARPVAPPGEVREGSKAGDEWVNAQGMVFCWCPAGSFRMGSPVDLPGRRDDEGPAEVTLSRGFWVGKFELTKRECTRRSGGSIATDKNHPIDNIHWDDIQAYLRSLNKTEREAGRLPDGWAYGLPFEAEWEYAARAGTTTPYYFGEDISLLPKHANFADRSLYETGDRFYGYADRKLNDGAARLAVVGSYEPNPWGLHDVYGNVWEWCQTRYRAELDAGVDPFVEDRKDRGGPVARGGGWTSLPGYCRSAFRHSFATRDEQIFLGYRIVLRQR